MLYITIEFILILSVESMDQITFEVRLHGHRE